MSEGPADSKKATGKRSAQVLRQRRGGVGPEIIQRNREHQRTRRRITEALQAGPKTVPEIAETTGLPSHEVFWHLMAMKKYGKVEEGQQQGDYFQYVLKLEREKGT
jgi:hypothetical protein